MPEALFCGPDGARERSGEAGALAGEAGAYPLVRVVLVTAPAPQEGAGDADDARAVDLEVAAERAQQELRLLAVADVGCRKLNRNCPWTSAASHSLFGQAACPALWCSSVQRRARQGRVEHELVELGVVGHGVLDGLVDVLGGVLLQPDDGRAQHADAVRLELGDQREGVDPSQLGVARSSCPSRPIHTQEMPRPTSCSMV